MYRVMRTRECPPDKPWGVVNPDTEDCRGCHPTKTEAQAHRDELMAAIPDGVPDSVLPAHPLHSLKQRAVPEDATPEFRRW